MLRHGRAESPDEAFTAIFQKLLEPSRGPGPAQLPTAAEIIGRIFDYIKIGNEQYREMVVEKVMGTLGVADIEDQLEEQLIDGILYAF